MFQVSHNIMEDNRRLYMQLADLYNRELVDIIGWAKQVPGFSNLIINDQMRLLQSTWIEIFTFRLCWRSLTNTGKIKFSQDLYLDERIASQCHCLVLYYHCIRIVEKIQQLGLTEEEYIILKALILTNSDVKLDKPHSLYSFRESILNWLSNSVSLIRPGQTLQATQYMFLILPSLRQADVLTRKFWSNVYWSGKITMDNLLVEMLGITYSQ